MRRPLSLAARLVGLALAVLAAVALVAGWAAWRQAVREAAELFDAQLAQTGETLLAIALRADDDAAGEAPLRHRYQQRLMFQVWHEDDGAWQLVLRSANAPLTALPAQPGYADRLIDARSWRLYATADGRDRTRVVVGQDLHFRDALARRIAMRTVLPLLVALPLLAALLAWAMRGGLAPLRRLADALGARHAAHLEPIALAGAPRELVPVVGALNALLERLGRALDNERRFTADAAHELRTPLAALQAQVQVAQLAHTPAERASALDKCRQGTRRMTHLVEQLLTLARLEASEAPPPGEWADLATIAREVCAEHGTQAVRKDIALALEAPAAARVRGVDGLLRILLRNLVDNALRYTPAGGRVEVEVAAHAGALRLCVADSGPGLEEGARAGLGRRFHRLAEADSEGVGLGLSIVARIAQLHDSAPRYARSALGGLLVELRLAGA